MKEIAGEVYNDNDTVNLGSIELKKHDAREYY